MSAAHRRADRRQRRPRPRSAIATRATSPPSAARRPWPTSGWIKLTGFPAWVLWALAHVWFLIGWRNRFVVALNWMWNYVTFERGARLITAAARGGEARCGAVLARPPEDARTDMMLED